MCCEKVSCRLVSGIDPKASLGLRADPCEDFCERLVNHGVRLCGILRLVGVQGKDPRIAGFGTLRKVPCLFDTVGTDPHCPCDLLLGAGKLREGVFGGGLCRLLCLGCAVALRTERSLLPGDFAITLFVFAEKLKGVWDREDFLLARGMRKYLSVTRDSAAAMRMEVHAMHDATEGGVLGAVWEMAEASGCGAALKREMIPVLDVTERACEALGLDPLRLISSGALLIAAPEGERVRELLCASGVAVEIIGKAVETGVTLDGKPIEPPEADELLRLF